MQSIRVRLWLGNDFICLCAMHWRFCVNSLYNLRDVTNVHVPQASCSSLVFGHDNFFVIEVPLRAMFDIA